MKIGLIGLALPPIMGGVETYNWELARHLARLGNEVHLLGVKNYKGIINPAYEVIEDVHIHRVSGSISIKHYNFWEFSQYRLSKKIRKINRKSPFDILHAQAVFPPGLAAFLAASNIGVPYVITSHGIEIMLWSRNLLYLKWRKYFIRKIFNQASAVIAVSDELKNLSIENGAAPERVITYSNATDLERFKPGINGEQLRQRLGFKANDVVALSLRRLVPKNGVQYLVDIAKIVHSQNKQIKFLICGDGPLLKSMSERVSAFGLNDQFRFMKTIQNSEVPKYIAAANVAVFPSLAEATSIACLECMAMGKPVITSNVGGLPEIVEHQKSGVLVDFIKTNSSFVDYGLPTIVIEEFAQHLVALATDNERCRIMGEYGAHYVRKNHTWDRYVYRVIELYQDKIQQSG